MAHEGNTFFPVKWRKTVAKGKKYEKLGISSKPFKGMLNSSESIWLMDGKRKKMVSKVQFVKKSHFLEGLFDVTALTFFIQKFV